MKRKTLGCLIAGLLCRDCLQGGDTEGNSVYGKSFRGVWRSIF
ncbi:hypothetical protein [Taurinivorans muris]